MQNYENADVYARVWPNLVDLATHTTLALDPGQQTTAGVGIWVNGSVKDLPADYKDQYLEPVALKTKTKGATTEPAAPAAEPKE